MDCAISQNRTRLCSWSNTVGWQRYITKLSFVVWVLNHKSRLLLQTFWINFMDQLADQIGVKPNLKKLFWEDPLFAMRCFFGPCVPAQYRLHGPGNWQGARNTICCAFSNLSYATRTRTVEKHETTWQLVYAYFVKLFFLVVGIVIFVNLVAILWS
jgi:hypothetical protein